jgi:hypothetical protein
MLFVRGSSDNFFVAWLRRRFVDDNRVRGIRDSRISDSGFSHSRAMGINTSSQGHTRHQSRDQELKFVISHKLRSMFVLVSVFAS